MTARASWVVAGALGAIAASPTASRADRYEATLAIRPVGVSANMKEDGAPSNASVLGAGGAIGFSYGLRNWLDVGGELVGATLAQASYTDAHVMVAGTERTGLVTRTTRFGQARLGATFRLGVAWVPTVFVGLGVGPRLRGTATLVSDAQGPLNIVPDGGAAKTAVDLAPVLRLGLEHRVDRHWTIGLAAGGAYEYALSGPAMTSLEASLSVAYTWYPLW